MFEMQELFTLLWDVQFLYFFVNFIGRLYTVPTNKEDDIVFH